MLQLDFILQLVNETTMWQSQYVDYEWMWEESIYQRWRVGRALSL